MSSYTIKEDGSVVVRKCDEGATVLPESVCGQLLQQTKPLEPIKETQPIAEVQ